ncbi:Uncharacterised protein [uncultured archaeon]|nr:Uncharacterised protein [uncultured archaeon]
MQHICVESFLRKKQPIEKQDNAWLIRIEERLDVLKRVQSIKAPHSKETEEAVIGFALNHPQRLQGLNELIEPGQFYFERHYYLWKEMIRLGSKCNVKNLEMVLRKQPYWRRNHRETDGSLDFRFIESLKRNGAAITESESEKHIEVLVKTYLLRQILVLCYQNAMKLGRNETFGSVQNDTEKDRK